LDKLSCALVESPADIAMNANRNIFFMRVVLVSQFMKIYSKTNTFHPSLPLNLPYDPLPFACR
jgi:hypothetical protein